MGIRSRISIPGGTCEFDLPAYFDWQHKPSEVRRADLARWCQTVQPLSEGIGFLLQMLRDSGMPQKVVVTAGQFQQNLPQGRTFQLLRLRLDRTVALSRDQWQPLDGVGENDATRCGRSIACSH